MSYIPLVLNHLHSIQLHAKAASVQASIDCATFHLELKGHGRYFTLHPQFMGRVQGRYVYTSHLNENTVGFIGWLPYQPVSWMQVSDKLQFKQLLSQHGLRTPRQIIDTDPPGTGYVLKRSAGSFGYGLMGPFRADSPTPRDGSSNDGASAGGVGFFEEFIPGAILKAWFWGDEVFFAHRHEYPTIVGNGELSVRSLIQHRLAAIGERFDGQGDQQTILSCLAFQGITEDTVPAQGKELWIDYRYGRRYTRLVARSTSDSDLAALPDTVQVSLSHIGKLLGGRLERHFGAPILYSVDGVIDAAGEVWWLEANTNPMLPPDGYRQVLSTLFNLKHRNPIPSPDAMPILH